MIIYRTTCPVHNTTLDTSDVVKVKTAMTVNSRPIFFCPTCKRYYLYSKQVHSNPEKTAKEYKDYPVYFTSNVYTLFREGEQPKHSRNNIGGSIWKNGQGQNVQPKKGPLAQPSANVNENGEKVVRIHRLKKEDIDVKLQTNFNNIRALYPNLVTDQMTIYDLLLKVFPSNLKQKIVVRNETFMGNKGTPIRRVELYNKNSSYLNRRLPEGVYLAFGGRVTNGEFYVTEIRIWEHPILKDDDTEADVVFMYDGPKHANWLYDVTEKVAEHAEQLEGELADWNAYLDWKRQLAELRIRGMKYIGFRFDIKAEEVTFLVVTEGKNAFDEFRKHLRRNEISVFSNNYSNSRWYFEFNREYQDFGNNDDSGVALTFARFGDTYGIDDIDLYAWDDIRSHAKKYERNDEYSSTRQLISGIRRNYFEPYVAEVVFELSSNAMLTINRQMRRYGNVAEDIEETLAEEFYGDGYIATSQIGDFALLKRLKQAVHDLANGKTASHGLDQWLFDIKKARVPEKIEKVTNWQNPSINDKQKEAVEKILSVPDVCLIQGPPGTGKTTVIAEAIYQLVIRNKRVLVASQANLAVDNALERLISNPKIRAIRLGSAKKIDSSVSNITEGNVLETFYDSILSYVNQQYVGKWDRIDAIKEAGKYDLQRYQSALTNQKEVDLAIAGKKAELEALNSEWDSNAEYAEQNSLRTQKANLMLLQSFCQGQVDNLELMISKEALVSLWKVMEQYLVALKDQGLTLTKVGLDINALDRPQRINRANEIIKYILMNSRLSAKVLTKLKSSEQFGGDSREIEELKIQEQLLKEKVLKEMKPEDMAKWQEVNKKIAELSENGAGLTDAELALFSDDILKLPEEEKKMQMISVLERTQPLLEMLVQDIAKEAAEQIDLISDKQTAFDEKAAAGEQRKETLAGEIGELSLTNTKNVRMTEAILRKYKATKDNLAEVINEFGNKAEKSIKVAVDREDWEDIFRGLQSWVDEIPDYSQEKEVFLKDFINGCNVVGVSCTENARTLTENGFDDFDVVIIDEVSKATPPELLIPMLRGRKVVLVGDHRQLPPLFNEHEKTYQEVAEQQEGMEDVIVPLTMADFNKYKDMVTASLFERYFENAGSSIKETLIYQYRMHSDIMDIINIFYDKHLKDGNEDNYTYDTKAHYLDIRSVSGTEMIMPDRHAYWFDSSEVLGEKIYEQRKHGSTSAENLVEAEMIMELLRKMELQYANRKNRTIPVSVGVISFYYDQVAMIRQMIRAESFHAIDVEVNTVDRFQGKEKEIIFVSLVRNVRRAAHNVDSHIAAFQRINVAFSRAQNLLVIVGAKDMYAEQPVKITDMNNGEEKVIMAYKEIIEMLDQRGTYFTSDEVLSDVKAYDILQKLSNTGGNEA